MAENCSKIGCTITANSQGTSTWFSARATATGLTGKTFFWFGLFFSFFRSSGVVRNYQAKLIRDFLPLGVVQKQMKPDEWICPSCEQLPRKSVFHEKKPPRLRLSHISLAEHIVNQKHRSQRHATLRDFLNVTCSYCIVLKLRNYMAQY